jgi:hypothetical protein
MHSFLWKKSVPSDGSGKQNLQQIFELYFPCQTLNFPYLMKIILSVLENLIGNRWCWKYVLLNWFKFFQRISEEEFRDFFFFFKWDWGLKSGFHVCKADVTLLEPHLQSILLWSLKNNLPGWPGTARPSQLPK